MTRIGIVGGGPGGLFAAQMLEEFCAGLCEITLFEAGPRVGGKVLTEQFKTAPVMYEAGVAELYDYSHFGPDPVKQLAKKLGLETVRMTGPTVVLGDAILVNNRDIRAHFGAKTVKALQNFHQRCKEMCTPDDYYEGHWQNDNQNPWANKTFREILDEIPDETARKYVEVASRSDVATEPHSTSALNGMKNVLMDDPRYLRLYSIVGGIGRLVEEVAKKIKAPIVLNSAVVKVSKHGDGYRLTTRQDGKLSEHDFDLVIMALPNYWLQRVEWGSRDLRVAMQAHLAHYDKPAHYLRVSVLFKDPFWRSQIPGAYFMTDAFGGCCVYDEGARHPCEPYGVLNWLLAGNDAMALSNLDDQRLIDMALDSLPESLQDGRELFLEGRVHRWVGTISGQPGGQPVHELHQRHQPAGKAHPGLFIQGDYLFDSTINGVYDSADFVTDLIMTQLRKKKYMRPAVENATPATVSGNGKLVHLNGTAHKAAGQKDGKGRLEDAYHDQYYGNISYQEGFDEHACFNIDWTLKLIDTVWGRKPPFRLLDTGSACGLTLDLFLKAGIDAYGIENSEYIHAKTPARLKKRNILGDIRKLPFPDNSFDIVYDTCLCFVPPEDLDQAIRELFRVCRGGVFFSGVTADMTPEVIEEYDLFRYVRSLLTLWEWSEIFLRNGFRMAVHDAEKINEIWQVESEIDEDDWYWYSDQESMRYLFYSKPEAVTPPASVKVKKRSRRQLSLRERT
jgi:monoamine oxidase/SAM-dependent methyltransferase